MFTNYLKTIIRLVKNQKTYTFLNLAGLTIGISGAIMIILFLGFELNYDKFHENGENIYRVIMRQPGNMVRGSTTDWWIVSPAILKPTWEKDLPEIDKATRIRSIPAAINKDGRILNERFWAVDPEYLDIFTFPLVAGNKTTALKEPFSLVLTEKAALKYFGDEDPIGKVLSAGDNNGKNFEYTVTGVMKNIPANSHLQNEFLASFSTLHSIWSRPVLSENWLNNSYDTYLTLDPGTDLEAFDAKLRKYDLQGFNDKTWTFHIQPLYDIYFNRDTRGKGDIRYIYIFSAVGLFILFIACFNFINLSTARASTRAREIGIRKVVGAGRKQLIVQLIGESFFYTAFAVTVSLIAVNSLLPVLADITGKEITYSVFSASTLAISLTALTVFVGLLSGLYPALVLSSFQPAKIVKGNPTGSTRGKSLFRNSLVVIQFAISIIMIISTLTLYNQMDFIRNKKLGFDTDQIIGIRNRGFDTELFKAELLKHPDILGAAGSSHLPSRIGWSNIPHWDGKAEDDNPFFYRLNVDFDFMNLYGFEIVAGRNFSEEKGDRKKAYILNESAVKALNFENPVGERFGFWRITGNVIGVAKDFHFESLHNPITPLGIGVYDRDDFSNISVKIAGSNIPAALAYIEETWNRLAPGKPFVYTFLDEFIDDMYRSEQQMAVSFNYFTGIAIFIACLGLFGLATFVTQQKTKEIGIRKVLGAGTSNIMIMISRQFILLTAAANVVSWPLAWWAMQKWLENFEYRVDIELSVFFGAALSVMIITLGAVGFQAAKAAMSDPVKSLRHE